MMTDLNGWRPIAEDNVCYYTDAEIVAAVNDGSLRGGRTFTIANRLAKVTNGNGSKFLRALTRRLLKMEVSGLVRREPQASYANSYFWVLPAPPAQGEGK